MAKTHEQETNTVPLTVGNSVAAASLAIDQSHREEFANTEEKSSIVECRRGGAAATGEQAAQGAKRLRARLPLTDDEFDAQFDQLVDLVDRASVSGEHLAAVSLWRHAARRAYETGNLDQLAKLFRSGVPHSRQADQMLAEVFHSCKLMRKRKGGQRKLFRASAAARYASAARDVRRLMTGEAKLLLEASAKQLVWQDPLGNPVEVRSPTGPLLMKKVRLLDVKSAPSWDANAHELSKRRRL